MTGLLLVVGLLATPIGCPPEVGHIRWSGVEAVAAGLDIRGTVWDRDRDGRPSTGDVMRIEDAYKGRSALAMDMQWVVLKGALAKDVARGLTRSTKRGVVEAACETPFGLEDVPTFSSGRALARHITRQEPGAPMVSKTDAARSEMQGWARELCRSKRSISRDALARRLETHAAREQKHVARRTRQRLAREVAGEYAAACTKLALPSGLTFD